jgi:hypothetical protein
VKITSLYDIHTIEQVCSLYSPLTVGLLYLHVPKQTTDIETWIWHQHFPVTLHLSCDEVKRTISLVLFLTSKRRFPCCPIAVALLRSLNHAILVGRRPRAECQPDSDFANDRLQKLTPKVLHYFGLDSVRLFGCFFRCSNLIRRKGLISCTSDFPSALDWHRAEMYGSGKHKSASKFYAPDSSVTSLQLSIPEDLLVALIPTFLKREALHLSMSFCSCPSDIWSSYSAPFHTSHFEPQILLCTRPRLSKSSSSELSCKTLNWTESLPP